MFIFALLQIILGKEHKIAFGSCFKFYRNQKTDVFKRISEHNPDVFLWLGDAAYIDNMPIVGYWTPEINMTKVEEKFNITKHDEYYSKFQQQYRVKGIYDDHDSNQNNGGKFNPYKEQTKQKYLDFISEPQDSHLRSQKGIYQSFYLDEGHKVKIIMTDCRYESDIYEQDTLGEEQWKWLDLQFQDSESQLLILTSGVQIMHDDREGPETWFIKSKERLYSLIKKYQKPIIFLSGDVHYSEMMRYPCPEKIGQNIYEFTSSGLNFAIADHIQLVGSVFRFIMPPTFSSQNDHYYESNYGILKIKEDNQGQINQVIFETHSSKTSEIVMQQKIKMSDFKQFEKQQKCILDIDPKIRFRVNIANQINYYWNEVIIVGIVLIILVFGIFYMNYYWWMSVLQIKEEVMQNRQK